MAETEEEALALVEASAAAGRPQAVLATVVAELAEAQAVLAQKPAVERHGA